MQSSATTACRAMVMLVCLVAIPLAAVFGTTLPNLVTRFLDGRLDLPSLLAVESLSGSPPSAASPAATDRQPDVFGWQNQPQRAPAPPGATLPNEWPASPSTLATPTRPAIAWSGQTATPPRWDDSPPNLCAPSMRSGGVRETSAPPRPNLVPVTPKSPSQPPVREVGFSDPPEESPAGKPDLFQTSGEYADLQGELRKLGATYYRLETWGARGQFYHFHARIDMGKRPGCTRYFEATDPDPRQAMAEVLSQVRTWQEGR